MNFDKCSRWLNESANSEISKSFEIGGFFKKADIFSIFSELGFITTRIIASNPTADVHCRLFGFIFSSSGLGGSSEPVNTV
jgi:hypothetical protein